VALTGHELGLRHLFHPGFPKDDHDAGGLQVLLGFDLLPEVDFERLVNGQAQSELFFRSGSCSPYLNHYRAWQSKKHRTWLGDKTGAGSVVVATAPFVAGNLVSATSGATINSVEHRSV
jgi:hypothetical protein